MVESVTAKLDNTKYLRIYIDNIGQDEIKALADIPADINELQSSVAKLDEAYQKISELWGAMVTVMRNSVSSIWTLPQATIDKYISTFQTFEASAWRANVTTFKSQVDAQASGSWTLAQENANLTLEDTINKTENALFQAEIWLKNAKIAYDIEIL